MTDFKPSARILALALALGAVAGCATSPRVRLVLLATTDVHGHVEPAVVRVRAPGGEVAVERGGAALLAGYLRAVRQAHPGRVLLVDAGDALSGTLVSNLGEGRVMVEAMGALGYAAAAVGNHEFDFGPEGARAVPAGPGDDPRGALKARMAESRFPWLSANLVGDGGGPPAGLPIRPYTLVTLGGVKVGVVGGSTEETIRTTIRPNTAGVRVQPLGEAVANAAALARGDGAQVVVAVVHAGGECRRPALGQCNESSELFELARALAARGAGVDAIFGGHTHQGLAGTVAGIPVAQGWADGKGMGRIDLVFDRRLGRVVDALTVVHPPVDLCAMVDEGGGCGEHPRGRLSPATYEGAPVVPDRAVAAVLAPHLAKAAARRAERIGVTLASPIVRGYRVESPLGNLVADFLRAHTRADVGMTNGGGLRADLPAGELTYGDLFTALPFENRIAVLRMTGAGLRRLVVGNLRSGKGIFSFSGIRVAASCAGPELRADITLDDGRVLDDATVYTVGTTDFLALGGDDLQGERVSVDIDQTGPVMRDRIAEMLRARGGVLRGDDPAWIDQARPRMVVPMGKPARCPAP